MGFVGLVEDSDRLQGCPFSQCVPAPGFTASIRHRGEPAGYSVIMTKTRLTLGHRVPHALQSLVHPHEGPFHREANEGQEKF
jgi:hypothetical protein